ncbi:MAG: acyl-CoA dehydrogenase, partial [Jatrophihabitans sp.]
DAGLLAIALAEPAGAGLGLVELAAVLTEQGRYVAPVPLWSSAVAALAVDRFGTGAQREAIIPGAASGDLMISLGLEEFGAPDPLEPATKAVLAGDGWMLDGEKAAVPAAQFADLVVVGAGTADGPRLFLLDPRGAGVRVEPVTTTSHEPAAHLYLSGAAAEPLGGAGAPAWTVARADLALSAVLLGVAESAMRQAASYVSSREQFGRPLGTFQAVAHQLADSYIDVAAMRVTLLQAASVLDAGTGAGTAVLVAKWWAADAGERVVHRVQHVHGGIGVDVDYPIHRYLLWGKQLAATLGGASADLSRLGALLDDPANYRR